MAGIIFTIVISVGLPIGAFVYALYRRMSLPFVLGGLAFVVSQIVLRIPLLTYLGQHSVAYAMFQASQPILFFIVLGLSAGVFEELARYGMMRFFMKRKSWQAGVFFGAGHGGIEAVLFVGIAAVSVLFSPNLLVLGGLWIGGIERFFAMLLHIGLSIVVMTGVRRGKFMYVVVAIVIHGMVNALSGILPMFVPAAYAVFVVEGTLAVSALALIWYSLSIRKRGVLE